MKKQNWPLIVALPFLLAAPLSYAERPNLYPLEKLEQKYVSTSDITYLGTATSRCAGHFLTFGAITGQTDPALGKKIEEKAAEFLQLATIMSVLKRVERNTPIDSMDEVSSAVQGEVDGYITKYIDWFKANWYEYSSYYEEDQKLQKELKVCTSVSQLAQAEMKIRVTAMEE